MEQGGLKPRPSYIINDRNHQQTPGHRAAAPSPSPRNVVTEGRRRHRLRPRRHCTAIATVVAIVDGRPQHWTNDQPGRPRAADAKATAIVQATALTSSKGHLATTSPGRGPRQVQHNRAMDVGHQEVHSRSLAAEHHKSPSTTAIVVIVANGAHTSVMATTPEKRARPRCRQSPPTTAIVVVDDVNGRLQQW